MLTSTEINKSLAHYPIRSDVLIDILVGPSWVGKSWIVDQVKETHQFLLSTTTRAPRPGETPGKEYNFISKIAFEGTLKRGEMINTFILHDEYYGYRSADVDRIISSGKIPIAIAYYKVLDSFLEKFPNSRIWFIFPPDTKAGREFIFQRIHNRDQEINSSRLTDFEEQMRLMYREKEGFREKYPQGELVVIEDKQSAKILAVIKLQKGLPVSSC
ncbi:MAG: hypothetical protein WCJ58_06835 [bacterium]